MPTFDKFEERVRIHSEEHKKKTHLTFTLVSCDFCYSITNELVISDQFNRFWYWIEHNSFAQSYTAFTVSAFNTYLNLFSNAVENRESRINKAASNILASVTFRFRPNLSLEDFIALLHSVTQKTGNFKQNVTKPLLKEAKKEIQQKQQIPQLNMGISQDQMKVLFDGTFGVDGAKLKDKGTVKINDFYGKDDEDPVVWIKDFNRIAKRYKWTEAE